MVPGCLGFCRGADHCGGVLLRGVGLDDAWRGRHVPLPARGVLTSLGFPLRMDTFYRDPDRDDCRSGGCVCPVSWSFGAIDLRIALLDSTQPSLRPLRAYAI